MSDIFISYRHNGCGFYMATLLAESLKHDGYSVFFDKSSEKGEIFYEKIEPEIENCKDFIVILDQDAFQRTLRGEEKDYDGLRLELSLAIKASKSKKNKKYFRVELPNFTMPDTLPKDIDDIRNFDRIKYDSDDDFDNFGVFYKNKLTPFLKTRTPVKKCLRRINPLLLLIITSCLWFAGSQNKSLKVNNERLSHDSIILSDRIANLTNTIEEFVEKGKEPVQLFAGGGSVKNYISNTYGDTVFNNGLYMPMASTAAWPLVAEELSVGDYKDTIPRPYNLVLLSAEKANENQLVPKESHDDFYTRIGYLVEIQIGESPLKVAYQGVPELDIFSKHNRMVSSSELKKILRNDYHIYATSKETSATWRMYDFILQPKLRDNKLKVNFFDKNDDKQKFEKPFIILESSTYSASWADATNRITVCDSDKQPITCPMCIYFIVYRIDSKTYIVPKTVRTFLSKLGINNFPEDKDKRLLPDKKILIRQFDKDNNCFVDENPNRGI